MIKIEFEEDYSKHYEITHDILSLLPSWFGIDASTMAYCNESKELPMVVIWDDDEYIGFCSIKIHYNVNVELAVLGIKPNHRNKGLGKKMFRFIESHYKEKAYEFLSVKTLSEASSDEGYRATREFYKSCGFIPIEEFKELWDEANPCLYMIKKI